MLRAVFMQTFVLIGLESAGKSTLFNILTESAASDERNFRESTVVCREGPIKDAGICLVDTSRHTFSERQ
ncbi:GTPase [Morganella morganii]|uniref:GTPase n=2 Tax=Morganella morganii TaxID=582 RepID=UPI0031E8CCB2